LGGPVTNEVTLQGTYVICALALFVIDTAEKLKRVEAGRIVQMHRNQMEGLPCCKKWFQQYCNPANDSHADDLADDENDRRGSLLPQWEIDTKWVVEHHEVSY
jgi:hypothetical protein